MSILKNLFKKLFTKLQLKAQNKEDKIKSLKDKDTIQYMKNKTNDKLLKLQQEQAKIKSELTITSVFLHKIKMAENCQNYNEKRKYKKFTYEKKRQMDERYSLQKGWVDFMIKQKPHIAVTLNFNPTNYSDNKFDIKMAKNKIEYFWKLYLKNHLGLQSRRKNDFFLVCVIEHSNTNIHCHLAIKLNVSKLTDEIVLDEENIIRVLWRTVIRSGSVFVSKIEDEDWYWYMVKEYGFDKKILISDESGNLMSTDDR